LEILKKNLEISGKIWKFPDKAKKNSETPISINNASAVCPANAYAPRMKG